jgi:hypothetical protein
VSRKKVGEVWSQILGLFGSLFSGESGDFRGGGGQGLFSTMGPGP